MADRRVTLKVFTQPVRIGWCDECLTDSLMVVDVLTETGVQSVRKCRRCAELSC